MARTANTTESQSGQSGNTGTYGDFSVEAGPFTVSGTRSEGDELGESESSFTVTEGDTQVATGEASSQMSMDGVSGEMTLTGTNGGTFSGEATVDSEGNLESSFTVSDADGNTVVSGSYDGTVDPETGTIDGTVTLGDAENPDATGSLTLQDTETGGTASLALTGTDGNTAAFTAETDTTAGTVEGTVTLTGTSGAAVTGSGTYNTTDGTGEGSVTVTGAAGGSITVEAGTSGENGVAASVTVTDATGNTATGSFDGTVDPDTGTVDGAVTLGASDDPNATGWLTLQDTETGGTASLELTGSDGGTAAFAAETDTVAGTVDGAFSLTGAGGGTASGSGTYSTTDGTGAGTFSATGVHGVTVAGEGEFDPAADLAASTFTVTGPYGQSVDGEIQFTAAGATLKTSFDGSHLNVEGETTTDAAAGTADRSVTVSAENGPGDGVTVDFLLDTQAQTLTVDGPGEGHTFDYGQYAESDDGEAETDAEEAA